MLLKHKARDSMTTRSQKRVNFNFLLTLYALRFLTCVAKITKTTVLSKTININTYYYIPQTIDQKKSIQFAGIYFVIAAK